MNTYVLGFVLSEPKLEFKIIIQTQPDPDLIWIFYTQTQLNWILSIHKPELEVEFYNLQLCST